MRGSSVLNPCYVDLVLHRGLSELRTEAQRAYLGVVWWVMEPMLYMLVFYLVFSLGLRRGGEGFVSYLMCGLVVWKWFDSTVRSASTIIPMSVGLMRQVYLPKYLLPLSIALTNSIKFFIIFGILLVFLAIDGAPLLGPTLFFLPVLILVQAFLILAVGGFAAALVPLIPDLRYVVNYGLTMLFFMSGIFFSLADMSPEAQAVLVYNPMLLLIDAYRDVLLYGRIPELLPLLAIFLISFAALFLLALIFTRFDRIYPRVIG